LAEVVHECLDLASFLTWLESANDYLFNEQIEDIDRVGRALQFTGNRAVALFDRFSTLFQASPRSQIPRSLRKRLRR